MLYWICPECGHECSPAIRECPTCSMASESAPAASAPVRSESSLSHEIIALAENFKNEPTAAPQPAAAPAEVVSSANGHSDVKLNSTVVTEETGDSTESKTAEIIDWLVRPLVESAKAESAKVEPAKVELAPPPPAALVEPPGAVMPAQPAVPEALLPRTEPAAPPKPSVASNRPQIEVVPLPPMATGLAPLAGALPQTAPVIQPRKPKPSIDPATGLASPAVIAAPATAPSVSLASADLVALSEALREPSPCEADEPPAIPVEPTPRSLEARVLEPVFDSASVTLASEPLAEPERDEEVVAEAMEHQAYSVWDTIAALEEAKRAETAGSGHALSQAIELQAEAIVDEIHQQVETEQAGIRAVTATFSEQPPASLLAAPSEVVIAPAPPAVQWLRTPRPIIRPCVPENPNVNLMTGGPQAPTLAGPCLPPQLRNFIENGGTAQEPPRKPIALPTWLVSVVIATCLFLGAGSLVQYLTSNRDAKAASTAPAAQASQPTVAPTLAPALPVVHEHPSARFVEVAGIRLVTSPKGKPQLQYIVINHSGTELTGLDVRIAGRSPDAPSGDPLFSISGLVPTLGPYQSKEIHTDLEAGLRASAVPDWQSLRTEILIARR